MGKAAQLADTLPEELLVTPVVIDQKLPAPAIQEGLSMFAGATGLVVEDDDARAGIKVIAAVSPQVSSLGLARTGIELLHRGLVGVQHGALLEQEGQPVYQRLQSNAKTAHPFGQRGAGNGNAVALGDSLNAEERLVIQILLDQDPGVQPGCGQAAINDGGWHWCRSDGLAGAAGILGTDVAVHKEARRLHVELFADVLADLDEVGATLTALAAFGLVAMLDAGELRRQGLAARGLRARLGLGGCLLLFQLSDDGRAILITGILEQMPLIRRQRLALGAETDTLVMSQLQGQLLYLQIARFDIGFTRTKLRQHPLTQAGIGVEAVQFGGEIHAPILPDCAHMK